MAWRFHFPPRKYDISLEPGIYHKHFYLRAICDEKIVIISVNMYWYTVNEVSHLLEYEHLHPVNIYIEPQ